MTSLIDDCLPGPTPVIGMLHVPALPGSPHFGGDLVATRANVLRDAEALASGGVQALMIENFGDVPFFPGSVPAHVVAHLTALAALVRERFPLPLGVNVLRNDGRAALAVAQAAGAQFIRVNVLCGARVTDQGVIQGIAHDLLRDRVSLGATSVRIFADANVKHSVPLALRPLADEVRDLVERGGAEAVIASGSATGQPTDLEEVRTVKSASGRVPVLVGSGVTLDTVVQFLPHADGFIVGTEFKRDGFVANPVDRARVERLMSRIRGG